MMVLRIAWRSLWRYRRRTLITLVSIVLGTAIALVFIGLQEGVYKKLVDEAVRMNAGHVTVQHPQYAAAPAVDLFVPSVARVRAAAEAIRGVARVKPLVVGQAMISSGSGSAGVGIVGIDPDAERAVSPLARKIVAGRYLETGDARGVVVGARLAERLKLAPGRKLVATTNDAHGQLTSELLRVTGVFEVGAEEGAGFLVQVPLETARRIFRLEPDTATQVGIVLEAPHFQAPVLAALRERLAGETVAVLRWQEVMADLAGFIAVDVGSNYIFNGFIIFTVAFTILNTILMSVLERSREFATLLAIGTSPGLLRLQIMVESALLGTLGSAGGLALGGAVSTYFGVVGLDFSALYGPETSVAGYAMDPVVKSWIPPATFVGLGALIFAMTVALGIYPAWRSARISVPDVLRSR